MAEISRDSNRNIGGRVIEMAEKEPMVLGLGYLKGSPDSDSLVLKSDGGTPVLVRDFGKVDLVPNCELRRWTGAIDTANCPEAASEKFTLNPIDRNIRH